MKAIVAIAITLASLTARAGAPPALQQMYSRYHGRWHSSLRFTQTTERYRNDSLISTATWYETMVYPRNFRIDFDVPDSGNCVIFRNDSAYVFKTRKLVKSKVDSNDLLYMLGGMYFAPSYADVVSRFSAMGYDVRKQCKHSEHGRAVFIIGAASPREQVNQLWIDKKHLRVLRFVKYAGGKKEEGVFEDHKKLGNSWCEQVVSFYSNGKLVQKERYHNIVAGEQYSPLIFSPQTPWQYHWYNH